MSWIFDKSEVPQFTAEVGDCVACHQLAEEDGRYHGAVQIDRDTGLCRPCWRVVVLGPAMANR